MKRRFFGLAAVVLAAFLHIFSPPAVQATGNASAQLNFSGLSISPTGGTFGLVSNMQSTAYGQATVDTVFNSGPSATAAATGDYSTANGSASAFTLMSINGSASSTVSIPGQTVGSDNAAGQGGISGYFEITGGSGSVSVNFSVPISVALSTFTDASGQSAQAETILTLELNGNPIIFDDRIFTIGPSSTQGQSLFSTTLTDTMSLNYNQQYYFNLAADAETMASNVPEPGVGVLLILGILTLLAVRRFSKRNYSRSTKHFFLWMVLGALTFEFAGPARATYIGSDPKDICQICGAMATRVGVGGAAISLTEGNLREEYPVLSLQSSTGPTIQLGLTYNSYNADGSKSQIDSGLGLGWTHSYNTFIFQQRSQLFRMGPDGRVVQYRYGAGGVYTTDPGYFETITPQPDGSFIVTNKEQSWWHFAYITNTPFLVEGPVYRLIQTGDRNNNVTTLAYSNGLLSTITDVYGRTVTFTYTTSNHVSTITDPLGRVTTFSYDPLYRMPTGITDPLGHTTQYSYNSLYQITRKIDADGRVYLYMYENYSPFAVVDGTGHSYLSLTNNTNWNVNRTYLAEFLHRSYTPATTTETDGRGNTWTYDYDTNGYLIEIIAPDSTRTFYSYDPATLLVASDTNPDGAVTRYQYDAEGNRTNITDALGNVTTYTYDPVFNQVTSMTDPNSRITVYQYDAHGNRTNEIDPLLNTRRWTYDVHGNVLSATDQDGHITTFQYDSYGNRITSTDPLGNITRFTYDIDGNHISTTDALGRVMLYEYDALNRLIVETNALHGVTTYAYDAVGRQISITDPDTNTTYTTYDARGRVSSRTNAIGGVTTYTYDDDNNRISTTDPLGRVTQTQYDVQNRVVTNIDPLGGRTMTVYDAVGNTIATTDPNTNTTTYSYDPLNRRLSATNALGGVTTYDYSIPGGPPCCSPTIGSALITRIQDADGNITYYNYDELDRRTQVIRKNSDTNDDINPTDAVTTYTYDPVGNRIAVTDPVTNTTSYGYDALNRVIAVTNAAGDKTYSAYDAVGNLVTNTTPNGDHVVYVYDGLNRVRTNYDEDGLITSTMYDAVGNRLAVTDANNNTTSYTYDALNRQVTTTDALGHTTIYGYDAVNNRTNLIDRLGRVTMYQYDALNRQVKVTDALGDVTTSTYDPVGNLIAITDANLHTTTFAYDALNRQIQERLPDPAPNTITYQYDPVGNLTNRTDQKGQITSYYYNDLYFLTNRQYQPSGTNDTMTYDLLGRLTGSGRAGYVESYTYDGANRMTSATENGRTITYVYNIPGRTQTNDYPSGRQITTVYDARGRLMLVEDSATNAPITTYTYDAANRLLSRTNRNGTITTYQYDADNRTLAILHTNTFVLVAGYVYAYDFEGNRLYENKLHEPTRSETYQYDAIYRLTNYDTGTLSGSSIPSPVTNEAWTLDGLGNWLLFVSNSVSQTRLYGPANELTNLGGATFLYDADGNLIQDSAYKYSYDEENRLIQVQRQSDSAIVGVYQYDALGRRVMQITDPAGVVKTNIYFYDGNRIIEEQDGGGAINATYTFGVYLDEVITMDRAGHSYYYHPNVLWSVGALTDTNGNPVERYTYDAYGNVTVLNGSFAPVPANSWGTAHSAVSNSYIFAARQLDEESGLGFYRLRHYDYVKGRFLQRDPVGYMDSYNLYEYVHSSPVMYTDPSGLKTECHPKLITEGGGPKQDTKTGDYGTYFTLGATWAVTTSGKYTLGIVNTDWGDEVIGRARSSGWHIEWYWVRGAYYDTTQVEAKGRVSCRCDNGQCKASAAGGEHTKVDDYALAMAKVTAEASGDTATFLVTTYAAWTVDPTTEASVGIEHKGIKGNVTIKGPGVRKQLLVSREYVFQCVKDEGGGGGGDFGGGGGDYGGGGGDF